MFPRRRLLFAAGGASCLVGLAAVLLPPRHAADAGAVPVVEAPSQPVRVRPSDRGGMRVAGVDEQILEDQPSDAAGGAPVVLGPGPEEPSPLALWAQAQGASGVQARVEAFARREVTVTAATATAPEPPTVPEQASAHLVPVPSVPDAARTTPTGGPLQVQLAAVDSKAAAGAEWRRLQRRAPALLGRHTPTIQRTAAQGDRAVWRVRLGGFAGTPQVQDFCGRAHLAGVACVVARF